MRTRLLMFLIIAAAIPLQAATIRVPQDQPTIQSGIDAAVDGDTVLVAPGTYTENLLVSGKGIILKSSGGTAITTLMPNIPSVRTVNFIANNQKTNVVEGFSFTGSQGANCIYDASQHGHTTVQDCWFTDNSGGEGTVLIYGNSVVRRCRFENNAGNQHGGGLTIDSEDSSTISDNVFVGNTARYGGGLNMLNAHNAIVRGNLFVNNSASQFGGGIYVANAGKILLHNNTLVACNSGNNGGGGICFGSSSYDTAFNNIIVDCNGFGIWALNSPSEWTNFNNVFNNSPSNYQTVNIGSGSISIDPLFSGGIPFEFTLQSSSPCIDAGNPSSIYNDPDDSRNDIGAFPFVADNTLKEVPSEYPTIQSAIDAAVDGDTVLVSDGVYHERISVFSKSITIASHIILDNDSTHRINTVIDGDSIGLPESDTGCVIRIDGNDVDEAHLRGFTIRNGQAFTLPNNLTGGAGLYCSGSHTVAATDCIFEHQ